MKLSQAAQILQGQLIGDDVEFHQVNTDSRHLKPGDLYIARIGEKLDGHDFIEEAIRHQASAALVERAIDCSLPQIVVKDSTQALGQLAAYHRGQFAIPVIGVTGSCGKTTVKNLIATILRQSGEVLANESSFNNNVGMPLTLMQLHKEHQFAVVEMGTNHFGEIAALTAIAKPTVATITNAGPAHLEGLGDVTGVSRAKGEIFQGLDIDGIAVINADDKYASYWESLNKDRKILRFSVHNTAAEIHAQDISMGRDGKAKFTLITPTGQTSIKLNLLGEHNINNALTAAACTYAIGIPLAAIRAGLANALPEKKRLNEHHTAQGAYIIDDSYNANPLSVKAAINLLAAHPGRKVLVLGDMRELGPEAQSLHQELGHYAQQQGINELYLFGELTRATASAFGENAHHFTEQQPLTEALKAELNKGTMILVKGSRSMRMEKVVEGLMESESTVG